FHNESDKKELLKYDFFITGSDQVWNPLNINNLNKFFLTFTEPKKRIAYAPSISSDKLPEEYLADYKNWLEGMDSVSIREDTGAMIIKDLTGIDAPVLADPTLLLTKEEWLF